MYITLKIYVVAWSPASEIHKYINGIWRILRDLSQCSRGFEGIFYFSLAVSQNPEELEIPVTTNGAGALWYFRGKVQPNSQGKCHHAMIKGQARNTKIQNLWKRVEMTTAGRQWGARWRYRRGSTQWYRQGMGHIRWHMFIVWRNSKVPGGLLAT